jgi:hypothetical protein
MVPGAGGSGLRVVDQVPRPKACCGRTSKVMRLMTFLPEEPSHFLIPRVPPFRPPPPTMAASPRPQPGRPGRVRRPRPPVRSRPLISEAMAEFVLPGGLTLRVPVAGDGAVAGCGVRKGTAIGRDQGLGGFVQGRLDGGI